VVFRPYSEIVSCKTNAVTLTFDLLISKLGYFSIHTLIVSSNLPIKYELSDVVLFGRRRLVYRWTLLTLWIVLCRTLTMDIGIQCFKQFSHSNFPIKNWLTSMNRYLIPMCYLWYYDSLYVLSFCSTSFFIQFLEGYLESEKCEMNLG